MIYTNRGGKHSTKKRASRYGNPIEEGAAMATKKTTTRKATPAQKALPGTLPPKAAAPKFKAISEEQTPYGTFIYRVPKSKNEFTGLKGSAQEAVILDIDGTLQDWGSSTIKDAMAFCKKHHDKGRVLIVVTARDHEYMFDTSFNWLMHNLPYPFIGPFCRAADDPRLASEFKRELAQGFEDMGLYKIVGAADDNKYVNMMWKHWAKTHFEDPADFDHLETSYTPYTTWRSDLPSKGYSHYGYGNYGSVNHTGEEHIGGYSDAQGKWIPGYWQKKATVTAQGKNRPAGAREFGGTDKWHEDYPPGDDLTKRPEWNKYLATRYGTPIKANKVDQWPSGSLNVVSTSPNGDVVIDDVVEEVQALLDQAPYSLERSDLEMIVSHEHPHYTPAELKEMSMPDLRELAGISIGDYRKTLYEQIVNKFGGRYHTEEFDLATEEELEDVINMTRDEADGFFDQLWADCQIPDEDIPVFSDDEAGTRAKRFEEREELENEIWANHPDLTMHDVQDLDIEVLRQLAKNPPLGEDTGPLAVAEVLSEW